MTDEREAALDAFFDAPARPCGAPDAAELASEALDRLMTALGAGSALGDEDGAPARRDADDAVRAAALDLGRTAIGAMQGLVESGELTEVGTPKRAAMAWDAPTLAALWQHEADPYAALRNVAEVQQQRLGRLTDQPLQLFRRLHDTVALAADAAAWTVPET